MPGMLPPLGALSAAAVVDTSAHRGRSRKSRQDDAGGRTLSPEALPRTGPFFIQQDGSLPRGTSAATSGSEDVH
eukprot:1162724-Prorocentrum_lima.AAC.1